MRKLSVPAFVFALVFAGSAFAQGPAPTPTPPTCPQTAGLEIGMSRSAAFDMMRKTSPDLKSDNAVTHHHAPAGRPYYVDVTFASAAPDAKVVKLDYFFQPKGVLQALRDRWGEPLDRPAPGQYLWKIERCGVLLLYRPAIDANERLAAEEVIVEPAPRKKK